MIYLKYFCSKNPSEKYRRAIVSFFKKCFFPNIFEVSSVIIYILQEKNNGLSEKVSETKGNNTNGYFCSQSN